MIELYSFLGGKNLCNLVANITVRKIEELFPNAKTDISVINVGNFFVVRGHTDSDKVINIADSVSSFIKDYDEKLSNSIRVIDTILYNFNFKKDPLIVSYQTDKKQIKLNNLFYDLSSKGIFIDIKINEEDKIIFLDYKKHDKSLIESQLSNIFKDYTFIEKSFYNETYVSERFFGLSGLDEKYYHILLRNITYHLFSLSISDKVNISINSTQIEEDDNCLNINLDFKNSNLIVNKDWMSSLVLDVFPFDIESLKLHYEVDLEDELNSIIKKDHQPKWFNTKFIGDIVLV